MAAPVAFNMVVLSPQLQSVDNFNDSIFHVAMIRWAQRQISAGHIPLDGWFPNFSLGAAQFHHYQSLPHILSAYLAGPFGAETVYLFSVYLLVSFWPLSIYWGARLMRRSRAEAAIAAVLAPFLMNAAGYGFEPNSYVYQGLGLWTQLWGMFLLPLALGFSWRAIEERRRVVAPAIVTALTIACAFIVGYMALVGVGAFAVVVRQGWRSRVFRAVLIAGGAALIASWVLVPLISDQAYQPDLGSIADGRVFYDSFGAQTVLSELIQGQLFDDGNLPVISVLAALGAIVCIKDWRKDHSGRGIFLLATLSLLLFIGPASVPLLKLLPGGPNLQFSRFIGSLQLAALLLAGIGGRWAFFALRRLLLWTFARAEGRLRLRRLLERAVVPLMLVAASGAVLFSPVTALIDYENTGAALIANQAAADTTTGPVLQPLLDEVSQLDHGRVYAGATFNWGFSNVVGYVAVFEELSNHDIDQVGLTGRVMSLSEDPEFYFDEKNLADYRAFAIPYMILPAGMQPPVPATKLNSRGGNVLWKVNNVPPGYVRVVDTLPPAIVANNQTINDIMPPVMQGQDFAQGYFHPVAFAGMPAAEPSLQAPVTGSPGSVSDETDDLDNGNVVATVNASRPAVALLSASYDNRWTATVDGTPVATQMLAPTLLGVSVGSGTHQVVFHYQPYGLYWLWFLVAALTIAALYWERRLWRIVSSWRSGGRV